MSRTVTSLAEMCRPTTFQTVVGQDDAISQLAARVTQNVFTPVIITGRVGSGKTTLARIFGRALVCQRPDSRGSACGRCRSCKETAKGETDYYRVMDCAAGTTASDVKGLVANLRYVGMFGRAVCIMDEVHALPRMGFDALLGVLEPPHPHCTFVLVTVDANEIPKTIRSRCSSVRVRRVPEPRLVPFLSDICDKERIAYTETALVQLVRFSDGIVRQALADIDQLRDTGITEEGVSAHYGTNGYPIAMAYLQAVFDGAPLKEQVAIIDRWEEGVGRKVDIMLKIFLYILHNHFHKYIRADAVLDAMPRENIVHLIGSLSRAAAARSQEGLLLCVKAVTFWTQADRVSDAVFEGKVVTFNHFIGSVTESTQTSEGTRRADPIKVRTKGGKAGHSDRSRSVKNVVDESVIGDKYLDWRKGAKIWDALSYMVQEHDRLLNIRVSLSISASGGDAGPYSISRLIQGMNEVVDGASRGKTLPFLFARTKESVAGGEKHHVVAHVDPELHDVVRNWLLNLRGRAGIRPADGVSLRLKFFKSTSASGRLKWHHHLCRIMVRGLDPSLVVFDGNASIALLDLMGVRRWMRVPIGASSRSYAISMAIGEKAQIASSFEGLPALSAFGVEALRQLAQGWEHAEHKDRIRWRRELEHRKAAIASLVSEGAEPLALTAVSLGLREAVSKGSRDPYDRQRSWMIWPRPSPLVPKLGSSRAGREM